MGPGKGGSRRQDKAKRKAEVEAHRRVREWAAAYDAQDDRLQAARAEGWAAGEYLAGCVSDGFRDAVYESAVSGGRDA